MTFYGTSQIQIPIKNKKKVRTVSSNNKKGTRGTWFMNQKGKL